MSHGPEGGRHLRNEEEISNPFLKKSGSGSSKSRATQRQREKHSSRTGRGKTTTQDTPAQAPKGIRRQAPTHAPTIDRRGKQAPSSMISAPMEQQSKPSGSTNLSREDLLNIAQKNARNDTPPEESATKVRVRDTNVRVKEEEEEIVATQQERNDGPVNIFEGIRKREDNTNQNERNTPVRRIGKNKLRNRQRKVNSEVSKTSLKLSRQRYLEYKKEMRDKMEQLDVPEEHRANILGSVWAKGERQGIDEAFDFIDEKLADGILDEEMAKMIERLIRRLTTKR